MRCLPALVAACINAVDVRVVLARDEAEGEGFLRLLRRAMPRAEEIAGDRIMRAHVGELAERRLQGLERLAVLLQPLPMAAAIVETGEELVGIA